MSGELWILPHLRADCPRSLCGVTDKIPERMLRYPYGVRTIRSEAIARPQSQGATLIAKASFAFLLFRVDAWAFLKCLWSPAIPSFVARPPPFMLLFDLKESVVSKFSGVVKPHRQAITVVSWLQLAEGLHPFSFFFAIFSSLVASHFLQVDEIRIRILQEKSTVYGVLLRCV